MNETSNIKLITADTGYEEPISRISTVEHLYQFFEKNHKQDVSSIKLISKRGHILSRGDRLEPEKNLKQTRTEENNGKYHGVYLFNFKELNKPLIDNDETKMREESSIVMKKRLETSNNLNEKVFELEPLKNRFSTEQYLKIIKMEKKLVAIADEWQQVSQTFASSKNIFKSNQGCAEDHISRIENQRKSMLVLHLNLAYTFQKRKENWVRSVKVGLTKLEEDFSEKLKDLRGCSLEKSTLDKESIERELELLKQNILRTEQISLDQIEKKMAKLKQETKMKTKETEDLIKPIDNYLNDTTKKLEEFFTKIKHNYGLLIDAIKEKINDNHDVKGFKEEVLMNFEELIKNKYQIDLEYSDYLKICANENENCTEYFYKIYQVYCSQSNMMKQEYKKYAEIYTEIEEFYNTKKMFLNQISNIDRTITSLWNNVSEEMQQDCKYQEIKDKEDQEINRRIVFNQKLSNTKEQLKLILKEEENRRKLYIAEMMSIEELYDHNILSNVRTPCIMINFDETTDQQLEDIRKAKSTKNFTKQNENAFEIEFFRGVNGMDRVLKELEIVKNCQVTLKKEDLANEAKLKNMQTILEKSSDIFHHLYLQKVTMLRKESEQKERNLFNSLEVLEKENNYLKEQMFSFSKHHNIDSEQKRTLENQVISLEKEKVLLLGLKNEFENGLKEKTEELEKMNKKYENLIEENRKEVSKLKADKREIEEKIFLEVNTTMETLLQQLESATQSNKELQDLNHNYKVCLGDQQIRITALESQLTKQSHEGQIEIHEINSALKESFYGEHLNIERKKFESEERRNIHGEEEQVEEVNDGELEKLERNEQICKKESKSSQHEEIKEIQREITNLEKEIYDLKEENEELRNENSNLNEEILKIAMRDTEDQEVQTEEHDQPNISQVEQPQELTSQISELPHQRGVIPTVTQYEIQNPQIILENTPRIGELRFFMPYSSGVYVCVKNNKPSGELTYNTLMRNQMEFETSQFSEEVQYILDLNCLSSKSRELLTECTLMVVLKVSKILEGNTKNYVEGEICNAFGFEDDDYSIKDYAPFLKN